MEKERMIAWQLRRLRTVKDVDRAALYCGNGDVYLTDKMILVKLCRFLEPIKKFKYLGTTKRPLAVKFPTMDEMGKVLDIAPGYVSVPLKQEDLKHIARVTRHPVTLELLGNVLHVSGKEPYTRESTVKFLDQDKDDTRKAKVTVNPKCLRSAARLAKHLDVSHVEVFIGGSELYPVHIIMGAQAHVVIGAINLKKGV